MSFYPSLPRRGAGGGLAHSGEHLVSGSDQLLEVWLSQAKRTLSSIKKYSGCYHNLRIENFKAGRDALEAKQEVLKQDDACSVPVLTRARLRRQTVCRMATYLSLTQLQFSAM